MHQFQTCGNSARKWMTQQSHRHKILHLILLINHIIKFFTFSSCAKHTNQITSLITMTVLTITMQLPWNLNCTYTTLMTTPIAATIIIVSALMSKSWWMMRSNARYINTPVITQMMAMLSNAPRISAAQINYRIILTNILHYATCGTLHTSGPWQL